MKQLARDLKHQLHEQSSNIANKEKLAERIVKVQLQQTQIETSNTEKLLEDQLEVGPTEGDVFNLIALLSFFLKSTYLSTL